MPVDISTLARDGTAPVVVAATEIRTGQRIERKDVMVALWPASMVPKGAYASVDSVVSRAAGMALFKGEPILRGRFGQERKPAQQEVKITPGKRAFAIRVDDPAGIAALIKPNSRVDVFVTVVRPGQPIRAIAKLFMSNMRVLAIGTRVTRPADGRAISPYVVTLEVTPDEAEKLAIAVSQGSLSLALRGYGNPDTIVTNATIVVGDVAVPDPERRPAAPR